MLPALRRYGVNAFNATATESVWPYSIFQWRPDPFPEALLQVDWGFDTWSLYRAWALVKCTGRFPLSVFSAGDLVTSLSRCPLCGAADADISHALMHCAGVADFWNAYCASYPTRTPCEDWTSLQLELFAGRFAPLDEDPDRGEARIIYVGSTMRRCSHALRKSGRCVSVGNGR